MNIAPLTPGWILAFLAFVLAVVLASIGHLPLVIAALIALVALSRLV